MFSVFGFVVLDCTLIGIITFWLPMFIVSNITMKKLNQNRRNSKWTSLYESILSPFLFFPVLLETLGITMKKFNVTKKGKDFKGVEQQILYLLPFALLGILSGVGIVRCIAFMLNTGSMGPSVVLFWLLINSYLIVIAILFLLGRKPLRGAERVILQVPCQVITEYDTFDGATMDLSETGMAIKMEYPVFIDPDKSAVIKIQDRNYKVNITVRNIYVSEASDYWKYAFIIEDYNCQYEEYIQILYDRIPTLAQELDASSGSFDDLKLNLSKRATEHSFEIRVLARVNINAVMPASKGREWLISDFNYKYCTLSSTVTTPELLEICIGESDLSMQCQLLRKLPNGKWLFSIQNVLGFIYHPHKHKELTGWVNSYLSDKSADVRKHSIKEIKLNETDKKEFNEMDYL